MLLGGAADRSGGELCSSKVEGVVEYDCEEWWSRIDLWHAVVDLWS